MPYLAFAARMGEVLTVSRSPESHVRMTDLELIQKIQEGDRGAKAALVKKYEAFLYQWVRNLIGSRGLSWSMGEDLLQEGRIALLIAAEQFDISRKNTFLTYARWQLMYCLDTYLDHMGRVVKANRTRSMVRCNRKFAKTRTKLCHQLGREPSLEEIANALDVSVEAIQLFLNTRLGDKNLPEDDFFGDSTPSPEDLTMDREYKSQIRSRTSRAMRNILNDQERWVVFQRFFTDSEPTLQELGDQVKRTRERIRQIEKKALEKLKPTLKGVKAAT